MVKNETFGKNRNNLIVKNNLVKLGVAFSPFKLTPCGVSFRGKVCPLGSRVLLPLSERSGDAAPFLPQLH